MNKTHYERRSHEQGNYEITPSYGTSGGENDEILTILKDILGDTVTEWRFEQADSGVNPVYRLLVNGKPIHIRITVQPNVYDDRCVGIRFDGDDVLMASAAMDFELSYFDDNLYTIDQFNFFTNYTKEFLLNH